MHFCSQVHIWKLLECVCVCVCECLCLWYGRNLPGIWLFRTDYFIPFSEDLVPSTPEYWLYLERVGRNTLIVQIKGFSKSFCGSSAVQLPWPFPAEAKTKGLRIDLHFSPASIWSQKTYSCTWMWEFVCTWPTSADLVIVTRVVKWVGQECHNRHEMLLHNLIEVKVKSKCSLLFLFLRPKYQTHC